jgi:peroxiredoxin
MNTPKRLLSAVLAASLLAVPLTRVFAADPPAPAETTAPTSGITVEFQQIFGKISAKLRTGQQSEADLADELKAFDDLLAKHAGEKTDEVAMVTVMKARLYLEVFQNTEKGIAILKQVKVDFPNTKIAQNIDQVIATIEKQAAATNLLAVGKPFPAFAEKDLGGQPLSLANYKGKVVLVDFWATWCGPCVEELPNVIAAYGKFHDKGFEIIGVSLDQSHDALVAFIREKKMTWAQYFDGQGWNNKLGQEYGISSIPATFLLDRNGVIIARDLRGDALTKKLATLLP